MLERNMLDNTKLSVEVSRRLSLGIAADWGSGWFEGLTMRNRYPLLSCIILWEKLAEYVAALKAEQFKRALVFLRRAFGEFTSAEKRGICENLGEVWALDTEQVSEVINGELNQTEQDCISDLNDFVFGDI